MQELANLASWLHTRANIRSDSVRESTTKMQIFADAQLLHLSYTMTYIGPLDEMCCGSSYCQACPHGMACLIRAKAFFDNNT